MLSEKKKISSNFSAKQCQDNCFNDKSKYGCKYAAMDIGLSNEGGKGNCWNSYGRNQMTGEGDCYNEYELWENKEYKQPPPEEKTMIITNNGYWNRGSGATGYRDYQSYKKTHYISGGKSVKIKKIEVEQIGKDQGWGNRTKPSYVYLKNENGESIKGTVVGRRGWLPRVRGWKAKGNKLTDEKIFTEPYIEASSITVRIDSRGRGHRNVTSFMKIKITYLD